MESRGFDNVARQLEREERASSEATYALRRGIARANQKTYASSSVIGQTLIRNYLSQLCDTLQERMYLLRRGKAAVDADAVYSKLKEADLEVLGLLTMKVCLDVLGKEAHPQLTDVAVPIGRAVQTQLKLDWYYKQNSDLYKKTEHFFHSSTGTRQKNTVLTRAFNKAAIEWPRWSRTTEYKIGAWLLDGLMRVTGWLHLEMTQVSKLKRRNVLRYSREYLELRDTILAKAERLAFMQWPMLCPPIPHTYFESGGYLSPVVRQSQPLIRKSQSLGLCRQGEVPLRMINNLMEVPLRINGDVLAVANHCKDKQITIGKFRCDKFLDAPASPGDDCTEEELKQYKRLRRQYEDHNAQLAQKNWRTSEVMYVANMYADEPALFLVCHFDYRGRIYYNSVLNPQGTDFDRSLLVFAQEGPVEPYALAWHLSNCYGNDKLASEDRVQWTWDNFDLIQRIARDPIGTIPEWEVAAEPWCFMSACIEFAQCVIWKTKWTSGHPCGSDATQSGIQHLSAMTLDRHGGSLVNLEPGNKPRDGYKTVAEYAAKLLPSPYNSWLNRKVSKRTCMTVPYGVSRNSSRSYIRKELIDQGRDLSEPGLLSDIVYAIYDEAIPAIFPGPVNAMNWLQSSALKILETQDEICWTSPSGFEVNQDLRVPRGKIVKTRLMGSVVKTTVADGRLEPDAKHHKNALAPNVVHAADAALIHKTFAHWDQPVMVIHDCVLARSCDLRQMNIEIRHHFVEMYKEPVLQNWADQVGVTIPDGLIKNTLDIEKVNDSDYFFC